ncbi:UDP-2,3-diacylglucosamine hydrolase [Rosistilla carotiformis]|uniref:UDP-2,3-diacylglucosamine hydrolase n=1 Tax=Rosistilla carotiformis TaxID=2528017 RepID=A0A518JRJ9_9BACT|nr:UDP-2,3-diacylglucosamine diphosphatase [Rosistilla carotiformis]QDV68145.1 UDP-2,3-diacylglucosamine hydrolase [Rosistilla carotiformis]
MIDENAALNATDSDAGPWDLSDVRTLFISDVHLGSRFSQVGPLLDLLDRCLPQHIYLVGDLFDDRRLSRRFRWTADYTRLLARLFDFGVSGTSIHYTPGNHDTFLRGFAEDYRLLEIRDSFVHQCADGRRLAVLHGDQFDVVEKKFRWLSELGSTAYEILLATDRGLNWILRLLGARPVPLSRRLKVGVKKIVQRKSGFHDKVRDYARRNACDGVVCGHIHNPEMRSIDGILYCNTGDWIEHCTAMVEWPDGRLQVIRANELSGQRRRRPIFHRLKRRLGESIRPNVPSRVDDTQPTESSPRKG